MAFFGSAIFSHVANTLVKNKDKNELTVDRKNADSEDNCRETNSYR